MKKIASHIYKLFDSDCCISSLCWLTYLLSCYPSCDSSILVDRVISWSLGELRKQLSEDKKIVLLIPLVRFLSNVCASSDEYVITLLNEKDMTHIILELLNSSYEPICKETMLLVANIINNPSHTIQLALVALKFKEILRKSVSNVFALF